MRLRLISTTALLCLVQCAAAQQWTIPPPAGPVPPLEQAAAPLRDFGKASEIHDTAHIKHHLADKINVEKMTPQQEQFHYFQLHDTNKDGKIDGVEIMKGLHHHHVENEGPSARLRTEEELEPMVDMVLRNMDINNDGLVDWGEYTKRTASG